MIINYKMQTYRLLLFKNPELASRMERADVTLFWSDLAKIKSCRILSRYKKL